MKVLGLMVLHYSLFYDNPLMIEFLFFCAIIVMFSCDYYYTETFEIQMIPFVAQILLKFEP